MREIMEPYSEAQGISICRARKKNSAFNDKAFPIRQSKHSKEVHSDAKVLNRKEKNELPVEMCKKHQQKPIDLYCGDCNAAVCSKCFVYEHKGHNIEDLEIIYPQALSSAMKASQKIDESCKRKKIIKKLLKEFERNILKTRDKMTTTAKLLKDTIDDILSTQISVLDSLERSTIKELLNEDKALDEYISNLSQVAIECKNLIRSKTPTELILSHNKYQKVFSDTPEEIQLPIQYEFEEKCNNRDEIENFFGKLHILKKTEDTKDQENPEQKTGNNEFQLCSSVTEVKRVKISDLTDCMHISYDRSIAFWISESNPSLRHIDVMGNVLNVIDGGGYVAHPYGFHSVTKGGNILISDEEARAVHDLTPGKREHPAKCIFYRERYLTLSVYVSQINDDILIGTHNYAKSRGEVFRLNKFLQEQQTTKQILHYPLYITENKINEDIVISNLFRPCTNQRWVDDLEFNTNIELNNDSITVENEGELIVVDKDAKFRFSYNGGHSGVFGFAPFGVCCDILGHILVCNGFERSDCVHMLDRNGLFLSLILKPELHNIRNPRGICIDIDNNLWLGEFGNNVVKVYRYLEQKDKEEDTF